MTGPASAQYRVTFAKDPDTGTVVAEVPALQIADFGIDTPEALDRLQAMVTFHLDCLRDEGKSIPIDGEHRSILAAFERCGGNRTAATAALAIDHATLHPQPGEVQSAVSRAPTVSVEHR